MPSVTTDATECLDSKQREHVCTHIDEHIAEAFSTHSHVFLPALRLQACHTPGGKAPDVKSPAAQLHKQLPLLHTGHLIVPLPVKYIPLACNWKLLTSMLHK